MLRKFAIGIAFIISLFSLALFAACKEVNYDEKFSDKAKVIFELEGGRYLNSTTSVSHYYDLVDGKCKITPLEDKSFSEEGVTRDGGFELEGWYRTKTIVNGEAEYSDRWNFDTDTVGKEGVTLYAKWNSPIVYSFDFVYFDENGVEHIANSYKVNAGNKFGDIYKNDILTYANGYANHTAIAVYYDAEHKIPFDDSVAHPGGEESTAVKLYVEYIDGVYSVVKTAAQLTLARSKDIYLLANIDMGGKALSFDNFNGKTLIGNGYTISNFTVNYTVPKSRNDLPDDFEDASKKALCVAIFGNVEGATIKDVTFEGVTFVVDTFSTVMDKIYVAPLAAGATDSTFENVKVKGTFGYTSQTDATKIVFVTDKGAYNSENSTFEGCEYDITLLGKVEK